MQKKASRTSEDLLETYIKQIKAFPLLSFDDEIELSKQIQQKTDLIKHQAALNKLINSNLRLVVKIAGLFNVPGIPLLDMIQEGNIGLINAARKYDYKKNVRFCTYSSWWIRQFISRYIASKRRLVRLPQRKEETMRRINHAYHVLCQSLMQQPKSSDIANELGLPVKVVDSFINMDNYSDDVNIVDIHEDYTYSPELNYMKQISHDDTMFLLNNLKDREKRIINYRFQLNGCEYHTLREIGCKMDISPETVRQIEQKALKKIRSRADEIREIYVEAI
ncbi:MAG: RNA polymerase sigma factor RpoD/SigA [Treponema sp.]|nr:RNA polymerase sigma factor RpoD/SigA [Treponema sp.]